MTVNDKRDDQDCHNEISDGQGGQEEVLGPPEVFVLLDGEQEQAIAQERSNDDDQVENDVAPVGIILRLDIAKSGVTPVILLPVDHGFALSKFSQRLAFFLFLFHRYNTDWLLLVALSPTFTDCIFSLDFLIWQPTMEGPPPQSMTYGQ